ncbi:hypothetical protein [Sphingobacterium suaedae]|uniref:DUF2383 domain-containing protein n=1 Tax=Sphingobacterium suaedae TaxID=1686402 RepID=A0ABW5KPB7_9SPHI
METDKIIENLCVLNEHRAQIYRWGMTALARCGEDQLQTVFKQYMEESSLFLAQLRAYSGSGLSSALNPEPKVVPIENLSRITGPDAHSIFQHCRAIEQSAKRLYAEAIRQVNERHASLAYLLRQQAEQQYMVYNHITTLYNCLLMHAQAG